jgi:sec-independent protein translocase protein TatB
VFDISFSELIVVAVVALLVIGPEKLPKVARTLGALTGRMQKYVAQIKDEVNREVRFQELQQLQQEIQTSAFNTKEAIQSSLNDVKAQVSVEAEAFQLTALDPSPPAKPATQPQTKPIKPKAAQSGTAELPLKARKGQSAVNKTTAEKKRVAKAAKEA